MEEFDRIVTSDLPEIEKLAQSFDWVTGRFVEHTQHEIDLARAMNDPEALVKAQIKLNVMQHAREILAFCRQRILAKQEEQA